MNNKVTKQAIISSIPIFFGYVGAGFAFGILAKKYDISLLHSIMMSIFIYAGGMQYIALEFFSKQIDLLSLFLIAIFVNIRHVAYGIAMLDRYKIMTGLSKIYAIFSLTDETFAVLQGNPEKNLSEKEKKSFYIILSFANQMYWILGTIVGRVAGSYITFSLKGVEFALVALFTIIFIEQWKNNVDHKPAILGFIIAAVVVIFNQGSNMITISIAILLLISILTKKRTNHYS